MTKIQKIGGKGGANCGGGGTLARLGLEKEIGGQPPRVGWPGGGSDSNKKQSLIFLGEKSNSDAERPIKCEVIWPSE